MVLRPIPRAKQSLLSVLLKDIHVSVMTRNKWYKFSLSMHFCNQPCRWTLSNDAKIVIIRHETDNNIDLLPPILYRKI